mmetsp:Transcript_4196/g.14795  ORF Transcript_4196/g.14795 Transcript_4196/m.14795 type:complete len:682 (-) Transcript_4196:56-2101(-)
MKKLERLLSRLGLDARARAEVVTLVREKMPQKEEVHKAEQEEKECGGGSKKELQEPASPKPPPSVGVPALPLSQSMEVKRPVPPPRPARNAASQDLPAVDLGDVAGPESPSSISAKYATPEYTLISPRGSADVMDDLLPLVSSLYRSETEYIQNLDKIIKLYLIPARETGKLKAEQIITVFSNVEIIAQVHKTFHVQLRTMVDLWPRGEPIGSVLESVVGSMSIYSQYVNNFIVAIDVLEAESQRSKAFAALLEEGEREHPMSLHALLSVPLNRIPQYRAMADAMLDLVPRNTGQYQSLSRAVLALSKLQEMLSDSVNESKYEREVAQVEESIVGREGPPLQEKGRRFVLEGELVAKEVGDHRELLHMFLFNDLLVSTRPKDARGQYRYRGRFPLQYSILSGGDGDMRMILVHTETGEQWTLLAADVEDKRKWMKGLRKAINDLQASAVFGSSLRRLVAREPSGVAVPSLVTNLLLQLEKHAHKPDLFGAARRVDTSKSRSLLDRGINVDCTAFSPEECATLLCDFLALLKDPVIPFDAYDAFVALLDEEDQVQKLAAFVRDLPEHNQHLLKAVLRTLYFLSQKADTNHMSVATLASALVPFLMRRAALPSAQPSQAHLAETRPYAPLLQLMVLNLAEIFGADPPRRFARANPLPTRISPHHAKSSTVSGSLVLGGRRIPT